MNALQKIPVGLQVELAGAALRIQNNAAAIYDLLDRKGKPVKVEEIQRELNIGPEEYRSARKLLVMSPSAELYITLEGITLKKYISPENPLRCTHLSWCLGLFEVSGIQLALDEDLLEKAPVALAKLINDGKITQANRLSVLRTRARRTIGVLLRVVEMYKRLERVLSIALLPEVTSTDWKKGIGQIRQQLKTVAIP